MSDQPRVRRIGLIVHPTRNIDGPLTQVRDWAAAHEVELIQVPVLEDERRVADPGDPARCDLLVSIGGDGTMLAAIRAAIGARRPALGVACGSLGALTTVSARGVPGALTAFAEGRWTPRGLPALHVAADRSDPLTALNDLVIVRDGIGQVRLSAFVDGTLYARLAGDGGIVCTALGSSAYSLAAGGPLVAPGTPAFVFTPLPSHGGSHQPLVIGAGSTLRLEVSAGVGGARIEIDGQIAGPPPETLELTLREGVATLVGLRDQEPMFTSLRRRRLIVDSPRIVAEQERDGAGSA